MKDATKHIIIMAALLALAVSCSKETGGAVDPALGTDMPISFVASLGTEDTPTKGLAPMTDQTLETFGLFTAYSPDGTTSPDGTASPDGTTSPDGNAPAAADWTYMVNTPYRRNSLNGTYDTAPARYWPVAGNMTFLAVAPYDRHITESMDFSTQDGWPSLYWSPDSDPKKQIDLCVAVNPRQTRQTEVPLAFHHATAQISFAANYVELEPFQFIIIDRISLTNIIGGKRMTINETAPYVEWEPDAGLPRDAVYELSRAGGHLNDERLPLSVDEPRGTEITTEAGRLFLVPQTYDAASSDIELKVEYTLYYQNTDTHGPVETVGRFEMETVMPRCEWKPDTRYRYVLNIYDITMEVSPLSVSVYEDKRAAYYAMVCSFQLPSDTKTIGTEYPLSVTVGPEEVTETNKEVDWSVDGVSLQDMRNYPDRADVKALPVLLEYRDSDGQTVLDPSGISGTDTQKVWVVCKKIGTANIKARTRHAATDSNHKEAVMELKVVGKGASIDPYGTEEYDWTE